MAQWVKNSPAMQEDTGDAGSIPGLDDPLEKGDGNPLQYSCLKNPKDGEVWQATVQRFARSQTQLSD